MSVEYLVLSKREERSVVQGKPVVQLLVHDLCFEGDNELLFLLLLLVELKLLALGLLDDLVHGVVALA